MTIPLVNKKRTSTGKGPCFRNAVIIRLTCFRFNSIIQLYTTTLTPILLATCPINVVRPRAFLPSCSPPTPSSRSWENLSRRPKTTLSASACGILTRAVSSAWKSPFPTRLHHRIRPVQTLLALLALISWMQGGLCNLRAAKMSDANHTKDMRPRLTPIYSARSLAYASSYTVMLAAAVMPCGVRSGL